jgi:hypothetical protein
MKNFLFGLEQYFIFVLVRIFVSGRSKAFVTNAVTLKGCAHRDATYSFLSVS